MNNNASLGLLVKFVSGGTTPLHLKEGIFVNCRVTIFALAPLVALALVAVVFLQPFGAGAAPATNAQIAQPHVLLERSIHFIPVVLAQ